MLTSKPRLDIELEQLRVSVGFSLHDFGSGHGVDVGSVDDRALTVMFLAIFSSTINSCS